MYVNTTTAQSVQEHLSIPAAKVGISDKGQAALAHARRGVPVFPLVAGKKIPYRNTHGHLEATTDPGQIRAWWSKHPEANIGGATGSISGLIVLDVDKMEALDNLQREFDLPDLRDIHTVTTPSGGLHLYFAMPSVSIKSRAHVLKDLIGPGLDVRADGGMAVLPPSETPHGTYTASECRTLPELPEGLVKALEAPAPSVSPATVTHPRPKGTNRPIPYVADGEAIPEGARNVTLTSCAGRLHDGTRSRAELIEALLAVPTETPVPRHEVEKIANSIFEREPCRPSSGGDSGDGNPDVAEILEAVGGYWYAELLPGGGKAKTRDVFRAWMATAAKHGKVRTVDVNGHQRRAVEFTDSCRQTAETAETGKSSVSRAAETLADKGAVLSRSSRKDSEATTRLILEPETPPTTNWDTPHHFSLSLSKEEKGRVDTGCPSLSFSAVPPRPDCLDLPYFRAGGYVGNAKGGTLYALKAFGWQSDVELQERVGYSRLWDFRHNHLEPLMALGLVVERDGLYGLATDVREKTEEVRSTRYSISRKHRTRRPDPTSGRIVTEVREVGSHASEVERSERAVSAHRAEREGYRLHLVQQSQDERHADALLCAWDEERGAGEILIEAPPAPAAEPRRAVILDPWGYEIEEGTTV